jgi:Tfp pilus tip-associated adhesin PilY1
LKDFENYSIATISPNVKTPPEGEVLENGQAIALASATTWERTKIRTMSFRSVTTFNRASFMTVSSKKTGRPLPWGERSPQGVKELLPDTDG